MELHFRPRFYRDLAKLKGKKALNTAIYHAIREIENAKSISGITGLQKLTDYKVYYRIKLKLSERENYRLGLAIRGNTVWLGRILPRKKFYRYFP